VSFIPKRNDTGSMVMEFRKNSTGVRETKCAVPENINTHP